MSNLVQNITQNIADSGVAVISMQPMEFAQRNQTDYINESNATEIKNLGSLLDHLGKMNNPTLTMRLFSETIK